MKSLLILLSIVALVFSAPVEETNDIKDYIEKVKCFLDQQPLIDDVNSIVEMIKTQDFSQAITLLFKAYGDVQTAISKCIPMFTYSNKRARLEQCKKTRNYWLKVLETAKEYAIEWTFESIITEKEVLKNYEDCTANALED